MPTYVYRCSACETTFEADQRITAEPLTQCVCGAEGTVKRVIQPIAVMFKGSGFHINDYAPSTKDTSKPEGDKAEGSKAKESGSEAKPESAAPAKSDSKPETASAAPAGASKTE